MKLWRKLNLQHDPEKRGLDVLIQGWTVNNDEIIEPGVVMAVPSEDEYDHFHIYSNSFGGDGVQSGRIPNGPLELVPFAWRLVLEHQIQNVILDAPGMQEYLEAERKRN